MKNWGEILYTAFIFIALVVVLLLASYGCTASRRVCEVSVEKAESVKMKCTGDDIELAPVAK